MAAALTVGAAIATTRRARRLGRATGRAVRTGTNVRMLSADAMVSKRAAIS